jgi:hypothetical protein
MIMNGLWIIFYLIFTILCVIIISTKFYTQKFHISNDGIRRFLLCYLVTMADTRKLFLLEL